VPLGSEQANPLSKSTKSGIAGYLLVRRGSTLKSVYRAYSILLRGGNSLSGAPWLGDRL
jgi:hypothetical protein